MSETLGFSQENRYLSVTTPLGDDALLLRSIRGRESLSSLFRYELEMVSEDSALDFSKIVGETVTVSLHLADGETVRYINGLVTEFSQQDSDSGSWSYRATIQPKYWLATRKIDCRIFQDMSVTDIIEAVAKEVGVTDIKLETTGSYEARPYCVQYNETVFDFLNRLMEDEGIFYFHRHEDGKHTLVIADDVDVHAPCEGYDAAVYQTGSVGSVEDEASILNLSYVERVVTDKYAAQDFNFETPSTGLDTTAAGVGTGSDMEVYEYPGGYQTKSLGDGRASIRMEGFEAYSKSLDGRGTMKSMAAGYTFSLTWPGREGMDGDYVLGDVSIRADDMGFENTFRAFPKALPFRPARLTRRPRIHGTQTAIVTGKSGEEIWTDKFGRIKVQFHWDREGKKDENTSCWIRVAQGWAGKSWGSWYLPRIGMEVVVSFLEGDPDQPLVTGCVYNAEQLLPYEMPTDQTKSTLKSNTSAGGGGSNEWRFEDKKGEEEVYLHAQKDWNSVVENARTTSIIEADDTLTIEKGNRVFAVQTGTETHEVKGTRTVKVEGAQDHTTGDGFTHDVTGDYKITVSGDLTIDVSGNITMKAGSNITVEAGSNLSSSAGQNISEEAGMNLTNKAGQNLTDEAGMNLDTKAEMNITNKAGMNLTDDAGMNLTLKSGMNTESNAGMSLKEEGGMSVEIKGGMSLKEEGGLSLEAKGGLNGTFEGGLNGTLKGGVMAMLSAAIAKLG